MHISPEQIVVSKEAQKQFDQLGQVNCERMARKLFSGHLPTKSIQFPTSLKVVEAREGDYRLLFGKRESDVILVAISRRDQLQSDIDRISKRESFRTTPLLDSSIASVYAKAGQSQVVAMAESDLNQDETAGIPEAAVETNTQKPAMAVAGESDLRFHLYKSFELLLTQMQQFETSRDENQTWSTMLVEGHGEFAQQLSILNDDITSLSQRFDADVKQSTRLRQDANERLDKHSREMQLGKNRLDQINQLLADSEERTTTRHAGLAEEFSSFSQGCIGKLNQQSSSVSKEIADVLEKFCELQGQLRDNRIEADRITYRLERIEGHFATAAAKSVSIQSTVQHLQHTLAEVLEQERSRAEVLIGRLGKAFDERLRTQRLRAEQNETRFDSDRASLQERFLALESQLAEQQQKTKELERQSRESSWLRWLQWLGKRCSRVFGFGAGADS